MDLLIQYALSFVGRPYVWGGESPLSGFDCSGLVQEILRSVGMDPPGDQTAQALFNHYKILWAGQQPKPSEPGCLVFYGKSLAEITHVGFMVSKFQMVEAGGGGHLITTREEARKKNAFVRVRPILYRADFLTTVKPNYGL